jgi:NAD(P)-dependent dehydrogenase (short-subunit alcohol dehydrogenase family)
LLPRRPPRGTLDIPAPGHPRILHAALPRGDRHRRLGRATAEAASRAGWRVAVWDRDAAAGAELAARLGGLWQQVDVTSEIEVGAALDSTTAWGGVPRALVTCAGIGGGWRVAGRRGPHPLDAFRRVLDVNLVGTFNCVRLVAQAMSASEPDADGARGAIVMVSSIAAYEGQIGQAAYAASKGGIASLAITCARDLAEHGVRCLAIAPGLFETAMTGALSADVRAGILRDVPFPRRFGDPAHFASLVLEALGNPMLNGCVLRLDAAARLPSR